MRASERCPAASCTLTIKSRNTCSGSSACAALSSSASVHHPLPSGSMNVIFPPAPTGTGPLGAHTGCCSAQSACAASTASICDLPAPAYRSTHGYTGGAVVSSVKPTLARREAAGMMPVTASALRVSGTVSSTSANLRNSVALTRTCASCTPTSRTNVKSVCWLVVKTCVLVFSDTISCCEKRMFMLVLPMPAHAPIAVSARSRTDTRRRGASTAHSHARASADISGRGAGTALLATRGRGCLYLQSAPCR